MCSITQALLIITLILVCGQHPIGIVYNHSSIQVSKSCIQQSQNRTHELRKTLQLTFKYPKLMLANQLQSHIIIILKNYSSNNKKNTETTLGKLWSVGKVIVTQYLLLEEVMSIMLSIFFTLHSSVTTFIMSSILWSSIFG